MLKVHMVSKGFRKTFYFPLQSLFNSDILIHALFFQWLNVFRSSTVKFFNLRANLTDVRTEVLAGFTTFISMSYILFVQPAMLAQAGMDKGAVFTATVAVSIFGTLMMAFIANMPIAINWYGNQLSFRLLSCFATRILMARSIERHALGWIAIFNRCDNADSRLDY